MPTILSMMMTPQYDFVDINCLFRKQLEPLLPGNDGSSRKGVITERDIKHISLTLQRFIEVPVERSDIGIFLDGIVKYFWVILKYSKQFSHIETYKHYFVVRMALDVFLFVMDNMKIYSDIASKFVKVIDKIVVDFRQDSCVKEFFRMYSVFLSKVPRILGTKHKSLHLLYELAQSTSDIETQAVIVEVILRLFEFNLRRVTEYNIFPEISDLSNIEGNNLYETIRMILDVLNKDSSRIFSINCTKITLDKKTVTEFDGAKSAHDIWLDIDMSQKILSFFCAKNLITAFTNTKFNTFTSWGVLSFRVEDALKTEFTYNAASESLEITIKIKSSSFNLFGDFKFDIIRHVVIIIPKHSDNFIKLVTCVLPEIFTEFRATELFKLNENQERSDNESTPDNLLGGTASSSPVISMLRMKRAKLSTISEGIEFSEENVINLISDDETETSKSNSQVNKGVDKSQQEISQHTERSLFSEDLPFETSKSGSKRQKISMPDPEKEPLFEKSITPISFTESMVGKSKKAKRKMSALIIKEDTSVHKRKSRRRIEKNGSNEREGVKISTSCQTVKFSNEASKIKKQESEPMNVRPCEVNMDSSSKVENWLRTQNTVEDQENIPPMTTPQGQTPSVIDDIEGVEKWIERHKDSPRLGMIPPPQGQTPSVIDDIEGVEKWMERHKNSPRLLENRQTELLPLSQRSTGKTESLLELLIKDMKNIVETQTNVEAEQSSINREMEGISIKNKGITNFDETMPESGSSDVPLSKLVKNWEAAKIIKCASQSLPDTTTVTAEVVPSPKEDVEVLVNTTTVRGEVVPSLKENVEVSDDINRVREEVVQSPKENVEMSVNITTVREEVVPSPKENLEVSVTGGKNQSVNSTPNISEESVFVDVAREKAESVDVISHFPAPVMADVTVVEFGNVSTDSISEIREIKRKKATDNIKNKEKKVQEKIHFDVIQIQDENHNISLTTKRKRPLYNPGDYSYLNETVADDYLTSNSTNHVVKRSRGRPKKSQTKEVQKPLPKVNQRRSKRNKSKKTSFCCPSKDSAEPSRTSLTLDKAFESLKKKIKEEKKMGKVQKKIEQARKGKKKGALVEVSSPSSPSSLEPFGKLVNKRKKANEEVDVLHNSKCQKQKKTTKVNVISNILVQPAATLERGSPDFPVESPPKHSQEYKRCFCETYIKMVKRMFPDLVKHAHHCNDLNALIREKVYEIANILEKL